MFKKILKGMVIGGAALTIAASAQAGTINVNLYGASAQFEFWTAAAPEFLINQGCGIGDVSSAKNKNQKSAQGRDAGIAVCRGVDAVKGVTGNGIGTAKDTVIIRYTSEASYDGIRAVMEDPNFTAECGDGALRKQADAETADFPAYPTVGENITALTCQDVHIGASDVAASSFAQISIGDKLGHLGNGTDTEWTGMQSMIYPDDIQAPPASYQVDRPIVVPFGFFANTGRSKVGSVVTVDEDKAVPFNNMSRLMAVSLFSGQVMDWNEFDPSLDSLPVVLCMRHAGSGTVATLDASVMRGNGSLVYEEVRHDSTSITTGVQPETWFNNGSSDMVKCVGENFGAVGYADADKCGAAGISCTGVKRMTWQGVEPSSIAIKNGQYDFWSAQWLYSNEAAKGNTKGDAMIDALAAYASIEANLPESKAPFWAAQEAMKWGKGTDFLYPIQK